MRNLDHAESLHDRGALARQQVSGDFAMLRCRRLFRHDVEHRAIGDGAGVPLADTRLARRVARDRADRADAVSFVGVVAPDEAGPAWSVTLLIGTPGLQVQGAGQ